MYVTNVRVSFLREKQPAQYEKATPAVEFAAILEDHEDHRMVARALMIDATAVVYAGLGYGVPEKVADALLADDADGADQLDVSVSTTEVDEPPVPEPTTAAPTSAPNSETDVAAGVTEAIDEARTETETKPVKRGRGRPKGSINTRPKAGTKAADEAARTGNLPDNDDVVPGDEPKSNGHDISTGDARVGPDDDPVDHGESEPSFTSRDLQLMIREAVGNNKVSMANAKNIFAKFRVARARDLTDEQVLEGRDMLEKMITATEAR